MCRQIASAASAPVSGEPVTGKLSDVGARADIDAYPNACLADPNANTYTDFNPHGNSYADANANCNAST